MILGRRYSTYIDPLILARARKVQTIINNLGRGEPLEYTDDLIQRIREAFKKNRLFPLGSGLVPINPITVTRSHEINDTIEKVGDSLDFIFLSLQSIPGYLGTLNQLVTSTINDSTEKVKFVQSVMGQIEAAGKQRRTASAVKDEVRITETFIDESNIVSTSLDIDPSNGTVTLKKLNTQLVNYRIDKIFVDDKRKLTIPGDVDNPIDDGYYYGNFYDAIPRFETRGVEDRNNFDPNIEDTNAINDNNPTTMFETEYVTDNDNDSLAVTYRFVVPTSNVGMISISTENFGTNKWVTLSKVLINEVDVTRDLTGGGVRIKNDLLIDRDNRITPNKSDILPRLNVYRSSENVERVEITLRQNAFYKIRIPLMQKVAVNGLILNRFNYLQSYILRAAAADSRKFTPYLLQHDVNALSSEYDKDAQLIEVKELRNRYAIGVRDIQLYNVTYDTVGELLTRKFNAPGNIISSELYVDESIPQGSTIRYIVVHEDNTEHEIIPVNRPGGQGIKRIVYDKNFKIGNEEILQPKKITSVQLKIVMNGSANITPILRSIVFRLKVGDLLP